MRIDRSLLLASGLAVAACQGFAAGFDCAKATSWAEKTICADPKLSKLDDRLAEDYRAAMGKTADAAALRASQRSWLNDRRSACKTRTCLTTVYRDRLRQLEQIAKGGQSDTKIAGSYTRWFQGEPDSNAAEITLRPLGGGAIFATGNATWNNEASGGTARTGQFEGTVAIDGNQIAYSDGQPQGCRMTITVAESTLTVSDDNGHCGGLNVSFDGQYRKAPD